MNNIDNIIHFIQDCYHLKDWIKNDPIILKHFKSLSRVDKQKNQPRNRIEEYIDNSKYLKIIADIANASKHLVLHKKPRSKDKNIDIIKPLSCSEINRIQRMVSIPIGLYQPYRIKVNYDYIKIDDLAGGAIREWDKFISENIPSDPFGRYQAKLIKKGR